MDIIAYPGLSTLMTKCQLLSRLENKSARLSDAGKIYQHHIGSGVDI